MKRAVLLLAASFLSLAVHHAAQDSEEAFLVLHDGDSHFGWAPEGSAWSAIRGTVVADGLGSGLLRSNSPFSDFILRFDVKADKGAQSVLYLRAAREGAPKDSGFAVPFDELSSGAWTSVEISASGANINVRAGGKPISISGPSGAAGYFVLEARKGARVELRNLRLAPLNPQSLFNGTDLSGWKSTGEAPKQGGMFSKMFGKGKPKEAKWTVGKALIHGAEGPGQLEALQPQGDVVLQAAVRINSRRADLKRRYALLFRGDQGQLGSGYEINIQPGSTGAIMGLTTARKSIGALNQFITLTVVANGRHIQVWANGTAVSDFLDVRPEGPNPKKDARSLPGVIAIFSPEDEADIDIRSVTVQPLPKTFGHVAPKAAAISAAPAIQAPVLPPPVVPPPGGGADNAQARLMQQQMQQQQIAQMKQDQKQQQVATLLQQALRSPDPNQQIATYDQILMLDPNNQVAFTARKDAQARLDADSKKAQAESDAALKKAADEQQTQTNLAGSIAGAEAAFLAGNFVNADQTLNAAEKIAPDNPQVKALRTRIDGARARRDSMLAVGAAGAGTAVIACIAWVFAVRRRRDPFLEIVDGLDKGKRFNIDKETILLGAIPEDGGQKNDVLLRDAERMISRFHAQVHYKEGKLYVVDTNSYNGTFVDKKRIPSARPIPVKSGSRVSFAGTCTVKFGFENRKKKGKDK